MALIQWWSGFFYFLKFGVQPSMTSFVKYFGDFLAFGNCQLPADDVSQGRQLVLCDPVELFWLVAIMLDLIMDGLSLFRRHSFECIESEVDTGKKLSMRVSVAHIGIHYC